MGKEEKLSALAAGRDLYDSIHIIEILQFCFHFFFIPAKSIKGRYKERITFNKFAYAILQGGVPPSI